MRPFLEAVLQQRCMTDEQSNRMASMVDVQI